MLADQTIDEHTPEESIAGLVDSVRQSPERRNELVRLLPEQISLYDGRSANATVRMRGYILAAFEQTGLPDAALLYVLEELENSRVAYLTAGAAMALRGLDTPTSRVAPYLLEAVENIKYVDDALTFECYKPRWPLKNYTTALTEVFRTLGWLGVHAESVLPTLETLHEVRHEEFSRPIRAEIGNAIDRIRSDENVDHECCSAGTATPSLKVHDLQKKPSKGASVSDIELEDQEGNTLAFGTFFGRKPSVVAFFYTKCDNPNKCSLTVTKLARLQRVIAEEHLDGLLRTAAITYDPEYDLPLRLKAYGENRGMTFGEDDKMLRTLGRIHELQEYFQLGVNFTGTTVNLHRIELFVLGSRGEIVATFTRLQWDVREVLEQARALLGPAHSVG
jgi:protein SCO1